MGGFDDLLKLPVSRDRRFELGRNRRHGFEETVGLAAFRSPNIRAGHDVLCQMYIQRQLERAGLNLAGVCT